MAVYRLSPDAARTIEKIYEYSLLAFGEAQADIYYHSLHDVLLLLAEQPKLGRMFHEFRRHEHGQHVVFYKVEDYGIKVIKMLHEREETEGKF